MGKSDSKMERLGEVLEKSLKRLDLSRRLDEYGVWPIWNDMVGPTIARNAQPEKIRRGTLFVRVSSPGWMQQLQYMKEIIAEKLNQRLGAEVVKSIFFSVGKLESESPTPTDKGPSLASSPPEPRLSDEDLDSIEEPEIRRAFKKLYTAYSKRKEKG